MADIVRDDVKTYVEKLISKEFGFRKKKTVDSNIHDKDEHPDGHLSASGDHPLVEE